MNGAQESRLSGSLAHCSAPLFAPESKPLRAHFHPLYPLLSCRRICTGSCLQRGPYRFPFIQRDLHINCSHFMRRRAFHTQLALDSSSRSEQQCLIFIRRCQRWLQVQYHQNVPSLINLPHFYLGRSPSTSIQAFGNGLRKRRTNRRKRPVRKKLVRLWRLLTDAIERVAGNKLSHVFQDRIRQKSTRFVDI